jgi:hypothetical protein
MNEPVFRGRGTTKTERLLADLGEQAFLNLWSYPNLFYEKKQGGVGDGKELCDMLVVCGNDIIIFSDKHINYQNDKPVEVAWPRFYRKAIEGAVKQINGADNWIARHPDKIFTDAACTQRLPIELPSTETRRVHGVVVATGAHAAIQDIVRDKSGSFLIRPKLKGPEAIHFSQPDFVPFCVGDVNPDGMFIHVFDDVAIKRVLEHPNTVSDFTRYLNKRAAYLRSGKLVFAPGEEVLLAVYIQTGIFTGGDYDFEAPRKKKFAGFLRMIPQGEWAGYIRSDHFFAKTMADEVSEVWDRLINIFTENVLAGTSVAILGEKPSVPLSERGLRFMAMENRFARRLLGAAVEDALRTAREMRQDRFTRVIMPSAVSANPKVAYVFMVLAYPTELEERGGLEGGYQQYRQARASMLEAYCMGVLFKNRQLDTAVGIALDAHSSQTGRQGGSEDLMAIRVDEWTPALESEAMKRREAYNVLQEDRLQEKMVSHEEYPVVDPEGGVRSKSKKGKRRRNR